MLNRLYGAAMKKFLQFIPFLICSGFSIWLVVRYGNPAALGVAAGFAMAFAMLRADGVPFWWLMDLAKKVGDQGGSSLSSTPKRRD